MFCVAVWGWICDEPFYIIDAWNISLCPTVSIWRWISGIFFESIMFTLIAFLLVIVSSCEGTFGPLGNALLQSKSVLSLVQPADCVPPPIEGLNLTDKEQELLKDICWKDSWNNATNLLKAERGIPEGVICTAVQWWVSALMCVL